MTACTVVLPLSCQYPIPEQYEPVMQGFFTSYMTEVYKAGNDVDYYETVLTNLFKKVLQNMKEPHQFEPFHKAMREPFDYYALGKRLRCGTLRPARGAAICLPRD